MIKKIIILAVGVLLLSVGGIFYLWRGNNSELKILNSSLPNGVRVEKSLVGGNYRVVNEIDGYEFGIPKPWKGIGEITYLPNRTERGYIASSIGVRGIEGASRSLAIDRYKLKDNIDNELKSWAELNFETFDLVGNFDKDKIGEFEIVKTREEVHFSGEYVYFFQKENSYIYVITCPSEDFIREIILSGKW